MDYRVKAEILYSNYKKFFLCSILSGVRKFFILLLLAVILFPLFPSEPYTGWKQIHTEHFTIVFEEKSRESALEVSGFCEDVYAKVTGFFRSYPDNVLCILHDREDISNGDFYPAPPHLDLYVTSPSVPLMGAGENNWLKLLLTHELTHYVNLTYQKGLYYQVSKVLGKNISVVPGSSIPGWAVEGIAVKLETDLTAGGRGRNPFFEMEYRAQSIYGSFYNWKKTVYPSFFPPYDRIYQAGYLINDYLSRTYGSDIFVRIYREYIKLPFLGFDHAVKKVTGSTVKEIFASVKEELEQRYGSVSTEEGSQISPGITGDYYLPVTTEKGWILYRRTQNRENALVLYDPASSREEILCKAYLHDYTSYTADAAGEKVVFASFDIRNNHPSGATYTSDLFLLDTESKKVLRITRGKHLWQPALSPRGDRLAAVQKRGQYSALVEVDIKTGETKPLLFKPETNIYTPSFSPDGRTLIFAINTGGKQEIALMDRTGSCRIISASIDGEKYFPRFSSDGSVIFSSDGSGSLVLYRYSFTESADEGFIVKICEDPVGAYAGTVYDGRIVYGSYSPGGYCLKEKPLTPQGNRIPAAGLYMRTAVSTEGSPGSESLNRETRYTDFPKLIFWLPVPLSMDPTDSSSVSLAPGIVSYFLSPMGKFSIQTSISLLTSPLQPEGAIAFRYNGGPVQLQYSLMQGYGKYEDLGQGIQTTIQNIDFTFPFIRRYYLGTGSYLSGSAGLLDRYALFSPDDFSFLSRNSTAFDLHYLFGYTGISADIKRYGSVKDIIPPWQFSISGFAYFSLHPLSPFPGWRGDFSVSFPSIFNHQVIRTECKWGYTISGTELRPELRGNLESTAAGDGRIIAGIDYLFTLGIMDIPLFGGLSLQGLAGGAHLEKAAGFSADSFSADPALYAGAELTFEAGYMTQLLTLGAGFNARIGTDFPESFNLLADTGIYFYLGTDSFTGNGIFFREDPQ